MTLNLLKLSVGVQDLDHFRAIQQEDRILFQGQSLCVCRTRMTPKRKEELLEGGSLYRVIKGEIQCRQKIVDILTEKDSEGISRCFILLDPEVIPVIPTPKKAFQGWRYLKKADTPSDLDKKNQSNLQALPPSLQKELRDLGLL